MQLHQGLAAGPIRAGRFLRRRDATMIHIPSLNTSDEVISRVGELRPGDVHRAIDVARRVGGKPVNVARFVACMGGSAHLVALADAALGIRLAIEAVDPSLGGRLELELVTSPSASRTDLAVVDATGVLTVVNGRGVVPDPSFVEEVIELIAARLGAGDVLVLAGSLPEGADPQIMSRLVLLGRTIGATTIVDSSGPALAAALEAKPDVVKVTARELAEVRGDGDPSRAWRAGRQLAPEPVALILSLGDRGARAWLDTGTYLIRPPFQTVVNPLGAGDAMAAGVAATLGAGGSILDGLVAGCGWAAAEVGEFDLTIDPERARVLAAQVVVERSKS